MLPTALVAVEDKFESLKLTTALESFGIEVLGQATDLESFCQYTSGLNPDIVFLETEIVETDRDIHLESIHQTYPDTLFVLVSHNQNLLLYPNPAQRNIVDYLCVPFRLEQFERCLSRVDQALEKAGKLSILEAKELHESLNPRRQFPKKPGSDFVSFQLGGAELFLDPKNILRVEKLAAGDWNTRIYTKTNRIEVEEHFADVVERLSSHPSFVQADDINLININ